MASEQHLLEDTNAASDAQTSPCPASHICKSGHPESNGLAVPTDLASEPAIQNFNVEDSPYSQISKPRIWIHHQVSQILSTSIHSEICFIQTYGCNETYRNCSIYALTIKHGPTLFSLVRGNGECHSLGCILCMHTHMWPQPRACSHRPSAL